MVELPQFKENNMQVTPIDHKGFISALSQDAPSIILFRSKTDEHTKKSKSIHKIISNITNMPPVYFYELVVNENEENQLLCDTIEIPNGLSMVLFKNGSFSRYKQNPTTEAAIKSLWKAASTRNQKQFKSQEKQTSSEYTPLDV